MMIDDCEKKWKEFQIAEWKKDKNNIVRFFQRFNLDVEEIYDKITNQNYDKMQVICYCPPLGMGEKPSPLGEDFSLTIFVAGG